MKLLTPVLMLLLSLPSFAAPPATSPADRFGLRQLYPTRAGGRVWLSTWDNGHDRKFGNAIDPDDPWFDTDHGHACYEIDGKGRLLVAADMARMYVHDPKHETEWGENLEITVYIRRLIEMKQLSYSGLQIFARTNHGTIGDERKNLCDDRGYGAKVCIDGRWEFEKETAHEKPNGYTSAASTRPWQELPKKQLVGVKYILRNMDRDTKVKLELWRDLSGGENGGQWEKMTEFVDNGQNFAVGRDSPAAGVKPELPLIRPLVLPDSESKKPMLTVYFRHEYGVMEYSKASVREIDPLP